MGHLNLTTSIAVFLFGRTDTFIEQQKKVLPKGSFLYIGDTATIGLHANSCIQQLKTAYQAVKNWDIADVVLAQPLKFELPEGDTESKLDHEKDAINEIEDLAGLTKVLCVIIIAPADANEKQLKLMLEVAEKAKPTNIALVLPPYIKKEDKYEDAELSNFNSQRAMVAKFACEQQKYIIDVTPPHCLKYGSKNTRVWINRLWSSINAELVPPPKFADAAETPAPKGKMQGLAALKKQLQ